MPLGLFQERDVLFVGCLRQVPWRMPVGAVDAIRTASSPMKIERSFGLMAVREGLPPFFSPRRGWTFAVSRAVERPLFPVVQSVVFASP